MRVDDFDFDLPPDLIALRPVAPRDAARLLVVREDGSCEHRTVRDLPDLLRAGDVLVTNDTRVIPARLTGFRLPRAEGQGAAVEITLHKRVSESSFRAFARPAKRLKPGDHIRLGTTLEGVIAARDAGEVEIAFDKSGATLDAAIAAEGDMPLPPYIASRRAPDWRDRTDYQTVYAESPGSVAAPTAGFHFTPELLARLTQAGIGRESVTLHVGPGTFLPVTAADTADHRMHAERAALSDDTARALNERRDKGGRIVAVGTTSARTLETAVNGAGVLHGFRGETALFITPGYRFKAVDVLLTNFHLPRSTLFMLVCAFAGTEVMKKAYEAAIAARYRFYSYGDACLLFNPKRQG
jgi:S-adenosylmethionine:tRNA ribosyltransferase-isomerase